MADQKGGKKPGGFKKSPGVSMWYVVSVPLGIVVLLGLFFVVPWLADKNFSSTKEVIDFALDIWRDILGPIFIVLDIVLIALFLYLLFVIWPLNPTVSLFRIKPHRSDDSDRRHRFAFHWDKVKQQAAVETPENLRLAIIAADSLVDDWLKKAGYQGDSFAERVSVIKPDQVKSFNTLWQAHRLRNDLVHTSGFKISVAQGKDALMAYEAFLEEMGAM